MKKFIAIALLAIFTTACTPTENAGMMDKGMMCEKCPCCQKMMEGGMKDGMMKSGMQCPMMKDGAKDGKSCACCEGMMKDGKMQCPMMKDGAKNGMKCECCQKMMKDGMAKKQSMPSTKKPAVTDEVNHDAHHPAQ